MKNVPQSTNDAPLLKRGEFFPRSKVKLMVEGNFIYEQKLFESNQVVYL